MISIDNIDLRYEPFPIGVARPVIESGLYRRLLDSYPPIELHKYLPKVGHKYSLSEKYNPKNYHKWIRDHADWREIHSHVTDPEFAVYVLEVLRKNNVDLGVRHRTTLDHLVKKMKNLARGRFWRSDGVIRSRFEFSMLPADGGYVLPHTDSPGKIITMVLSMTDDHAWDTTLGGGTDVHRLKDPTRSFNYVNARANFDEVDVLDTYEFEPNQCVVFIKTFNSWHSVRPMTVKGSNAMRRSLTINIELLR